MRGMCIKVIHRYLWMVYTSVCHGAASPSLFYCSRRGLAFRPRCRAVAHAGQSDTRVACLTVGMSPDVSAIVAGPSTQRTSRRSRVVKSVRAGAIRRNDGRRCWQPPRARMKKTWKIPSCKATPCLWGSSFQRGGRPVVRHDIFAKFAYITVLGNRTTDAWRCLRSRL
jgi:hypothetical protein